jgi:hypothetical protein
MLNQKKISRLFFFAADYLSHYYRSNERKNIGPLNFHSPRLVEHQHSIIPHFFLAADTLHRSDTESFSDIASRIWRPTFDDAPWDANPCQLTRCLRLPSVVGGRYPGELGALDSAIIWSQICPFRFKYAGGRYPSMLFRARIGLDNKWFQPYLLVIDDTKLFPRIVFLNAWLQDFDSDALAVKPSWLWH